MLTGASRIMKDSPWKVNYGKGHFGKPAKSSQGVLLRVLHRRVLVLFDRQMSSSLGRPCAIQDEE